MDAKEQKQLARRRRERKLRAWLITLSLTTPVVAFGGFFTIWHNISNAVNPSQPVSSVVASKASSNLSKTTQNTTLFQVGSNSQQVRMLQEQLTELGYFHHKITNYYGTVTANAVMAFQGDYNLPQTGSIDSNTLSAIQNAVKGNSASNLVQPDNNQATQTNMDGSQSEYNSSSNSQSNGLSQQQSPITTSSAS